MLETYKISFAGMVVGGLLKKASWEIIITGFSLTVISFLVGTLIKEDD